MEHKQIKMGKYILNKLKEGVDGGVISSRFDIPQILQNFGVQVKNKQGDDIPIDEIIKNLERNIKFIENNYNMTQRNTNQETFRREYEAIWVGGLEVSD